MNAPQITPMSTTLPEMYDDNVNQLLATIAELRAEVAAGRAEAKREREKTQHMRDVQGQIDDLYNKLAETDRAGEPRLASARQVHRLEQKVDGMRSNYLGIHERLDRMETGFNFLAAKIDALMKSVGSCDDEPGNSHADILREMGASVALTEEHVRLVDKSVDAARAEIKSLAAKLDALPDTQEIFSQIIDQERNVITAFKEIEAKLDALAEAMRKD